MDRQLNQPKKRFSVLWIIIAIVVVIFMWQIITSGNNPTTIRSDRFFREIGLIQDAQGVQEARLLLDTAGIPHEGQERFFRNNIPLQARYTEGPNQGELRFEDDGVTPILYRDGGGNLQFPQNNIAAIVEQGNTFYILNRERATDDRVSSFFSNPRNNATWRLYSRSPWLILEIIYEQQQTSPAARQIQSSEQPVPGSILDWLFPVLYIGLALFLIIIIWRSFAGRGGISQMGRNRATVVMSSPVRFENVAGIEEEKEEVAEIVDFLRNPKKYLDLGARIPKGFLLVGQPGTGKTLLAKAIAGEAGVPFFSISGSDFSEMLVGVGPSRMRDLFEQAKANAPCIIFIDEIDSIARMRGVGISGAAEENEQTLNQLLVQMDGFTKSEGVIVLAATNRPDVLDQALLRPGRFDRQIVVQMPDVAGREKILAVHAKNKPISSDVDFKRVAQIISGFTGADIENLMNESAIIAARKSRRKISMADITEGINKVLLGPQKKSRIITEEDKKITAYHEAGHAIVSRVLQPKHTVQEVSIIPRGMAAGYTLTNDKDDVTAHKSRTYLKNHIVMLLGGRAAESIFVDDICTGASQDLKQATSLAERMVTHFGMSDKLGPLYYGRHEEALMRAYEDKKCSESLQQIIDDEIRAIIFEAKEKAEKIMKDHKKQVEVMVEVLMERETIFAEDIDLIMEGANAKKVIAQIEERFQKAKEQERKEQIELDLATLDRELIRISEMAEAFREAGLIDNAKISKLYENFELARNTIKDGNPLVALPTLDNVDSYDKIICPKPCEPVAQPVKAETSSDQQEVAEESQASLNTEKVSEQPKEDATVKPAPKKRATTPRTKVAKPTETQDGDNK